MNPKRSIVGAGLAPALGWGPGERESWAGELYKIACSHWHKRVILCIFIKNTNNCSGVVNSDTSFFSSWLLTAVGSWQELCVDCVIGSPGLPITQSTHNCANRHRQRGVGIGKKYVERKVGRTQSLLHAGAVPGIASRLYKGCSYDVGTLSEGQVIGLVRRGNYEH